MEFHRKEPLIILVAGRARSGKGTIAKYLEEEFLRLNKKVVISPYTKYLKRYIYEITGNSCEGEDKPRTLLQQFSSKLIKEELKKPNFFIDRQLEDLAIYSYFMDVIIIPDVRFPREITEIKKYYQKTISIGVVRKNFVSSLTKEQQADITETALDGYHDYDFWIENDQQEMLQKTVMKVIEKLKKEGKIDE